MGAQPRTSSSTVPLLASAIALLGVSVLAVSVPLRVGGWPTAAAATPAPCRITDVVWLPPGGSVGRPLNRCEMVVVPVSCSPGTASAFVCIKPKNGR